MVPFRVSLQFSNSHYWTSTIANISNSSSGSSKRTDRPTKDSVLYYIIFFGTQKHCTRPFLIPCFLLLLLFLRSLLLHHSPLRACISFCVPPAVYVLWHYVEIFLFHQQRREQGAEYNIRLFRAARETLGENVNSPRTKFTQTQYTARARRSQRTRSWEQGGMVGSPPLVRKVNC